MRKIKFENHREKKEPGSIYISVITEDGNIESGWTCGRSMDEINSDFGVKNVNWFNFRHQAEKYIMLNKNKYIKKDK